MKKLISFSSILFLLGSLFFNCKKDKDDDTGLLLALALSGCVLQGEITEDTTIGGECFLSGTVFVKNNATLTVEPGSVVKGLPGSSLFILPGSKLIANGTQENPIVFTSSKPVGERRMGDWGGIVIIGKAPIDNRNESPKTEGTDKQTYGTENIPDDNSGTLRYVRIEFAGNEVAPGDELNGLSLYAVGSETKLEYIQIHFGFDDAIEFFGGRVDASYLLLTGIADDDVDVDEGYKGTISYVLAYRYPREKGVNYSGDPRAFELDGAKQDQGGAIAVGSNKGASQVTIENFTMIGIGDNSDFAKNKNYGNLVFTGIYRDCAQVTFKNGDLIHLRKAYNFDSQFYLATENKECGNPPARLIDISDCISNNGCSYIETQRLNEYVKTEWNAANPDTPPEFENSKIKAFPNGNDWTRGWTIWRNN